MKEVLNYYKWHIFFFLLFAVCILTFTVTTCTKTEPDLIINCVSPEYINVQSFNDRKSSLEALLHDADKDNKKNIQLVNFTYDTQSDLDEVLETIAIPADSDIIISNKETLEGFKEKGLFDSLDRIIGDIQDDKYKKLTDSSGRIYAVSLEGNDFIKDMGFFDPSKLYIAVLAEDKDNSELSGRKKNARNITLAIVKEYNI